jgi:uncharacterized membrane protein YeaQ/YmgE (transglycosylase-associated protein family)
MGLVLWTIIGGLIIGLLGKWVAPSGRDRIPLWLTVLCGIGGILIGNFIYVGIWNDKNTPGFDWWRHIWQVAVAAVLVVIAANATGRSRRRV